MSAVFVGLCGSCAHHRVIENRRGSRFHLCERASVDERLSKYPPLPVLRCPAYAPTGVRDLEGPAGTRDETSAPDERAKADTTALPPEDDDGDR